MAIKNHSGNLTANDTWLAADEHRITGNCNIGNPGGSRVTITVESGATIYFWGNFTIEGRDDASAYGAFVANGGSWTNRITILRGNDAEPGCNEYIGLSNRYDCNITMRYCLVKHAYQTPYIRHDQAGGEAGDVDCQYCYFDYCYYVPTIEWVNLATTTCDFTFSRNILEHCLYSIREPFGNRSFTIVGTWAMDDIFANGLYYYFLYGQNPTTCAWPFAQHNRLVDRDRGGGTSNAMFASIYLGVGGVAPDFVDCYFGNISATVFDFNTFNDKPVLEACVIYRGYRGWNNAVVGAFGDGEVKHCDIIECADYALYFRDGAGFGDITGCYIAGNRKYDCVEPGAGPDEVQYANMEGTISLETSPNMPLEIDNISEGAPGGNSITITFDSKAGPNARRCLGVGFIEYGTVSGVYTEKAGYPNDPEDLGYAWTQIKTDYQFRKTGHSVTINNLAPSTKYYYRCAIIDPLGRVGYSAEGDFTTTTGTLPQGYHRGLYRRE